MLPVLLALAAPPSFVAAVEHRLAGTTMHVVDWWADDLDRDHVLESIAFVCDDDTGLFLVQHGAQLLEMPAQIDGRNSCPESTGKPAWHVEHAGTITETVNVHHASEHYALAIRDGRPVLLREHESSIDVDQSGTTHDTNDADFEALTWSSVVEPPQGKTTRTSGPLLLVTDRVRRPTKLVGATSIAATRNDDNGRTMKLHVHADRVLALRNCDDQPCTSTRLARGDSELSVPNSGELEIDAGGTTIHVKVQPLDGDQSYPPPLSP